MNKRDKTLQEAFTQLQMALAEALHAATMIERLPTAEAEKRFDQLDIIAKQMDDLRIYIRRRSR